MSEEYKSSATKLREEFISAMGRTEHSKERKDLRYSETDYWIARALLEIAEQLDGIRFELSGSKG
jgi:hypothetical protein